MSTQAVMVVAVMARAPLTETREATARAAKLVRKTADL
jgi:hypothetical protein